MYFLFAILFLITDSLIRFNVSIFIPLTYILAFLIMGMLKRNAGDTGPWLMPLFKFSMISGLYICILEIIMGMAVRYTIAPSLNANFKIFVFPFALISTQILYAFFINKHVPMRSFRTRWAIVFFIFLYGFGVFLGAMGQSYDDYSNGLMGSNVVYSDGFITSVFTGMSFYKATFLYLILTPAHFSNDNLNKFSFKMLFGLTPKIHNSQDY